MTQKEWLPRLASAKQTLNDSDAVVKQVLGRRWSGDGDGDGDGMAVSLIRHVWM